MTESDRGQFMRTVLAVAELKGRPLSPDALDEYFRLVRRLTLGQFETAFRAVAARSKYFPDPAEVIESAPSLPLFDEPYQSPSCGKCLDQGFAVACRGGVAYTDPCSCAAGARYAKRTREWGLEVQARNRREQQQQQPREWQRGGGEGFRLEPPK